MKVKSERDFWAGLMFVVVGIAFAWGALSYRFGGSAEPGPGFFPLGLGALLAALGAVILFASLTVETPSGETIGPIAWRPLLCVVAAVAAFGWALPQLGMFVALPLLVVVASFGGSEFRWGEVLANAAVLTLSSWAIFVWGLRLNIPLRPVFAALW